MVCYQIPNPIGHSLRGLHGPADPGAWVWDEEAFSILARSKMQAVKVLTGADLDRLVIDRLHQMSLFVCARIMGSIRIGETKTGKQFVQAEEHSIAKLYAAGVRYFEVHNEPNLYSSPNPEGAQEGFGVMWNNGIEYAAWWLDAVTYLTPRYPLARWGFPAVSPGDTIPNIRYSPELFLEQSKQAVRKADWQAVHSYWGYGRRELDSLTEIANFADRTSKLVMTTEFSNPDPSYSKDAKGYQYENFYNQSVYKLPKNVAATFCYVLSSSSGFESETWRGSNIPDIVGNLTNP